MFSNPNPKPTRFNRTGMLSSRFRILLAALALALIAYSAPAQQVAPGIGSVQDAVIARVNGKPLLLSQLKQMALDLNLPVRSLTSEGLRGDGFRRAVTMLIDEELLVQQAQKLEMRPDETEIARRVDQMIASLLEGSGGREKLNDNLRRSNMDLETLRRMLIEREQRQELSAAIVANRVSVTQQDILNFKQERGAVGESWREVLLAHILIACPREEQNTALGQELHARSLEVAKAATKQPERFGELARRTSEDEATAARGGGIGWIDPGSLAPELAARVKTMREGDISTPVASEKGFHVLYLLRERSAQDLLQAEKYREERSALIKRLRERATLEIYPPGDSE